MADLCIKELKPFDRLSSIAVPEPQRRAILHIFANASANSWLVGGTALAGYYAEHRNSYDIDIFTADEHAQKNTILAVKSLKSIGANISNESMTPLYYRADLELANHKFTADVVLDSNLHKVGKGIITADGVCVADILTLLTMKVATLVSRCSEKDLYDIDWLCKNIGRLSIADIIALGEKIDGGLTTETLLISLSSRELRKDAMGFILNNSSQGKELAFKSISSLKNQLIDEAIDYEKTQPTNTDVKTLASAVADIKKMRRGRSTIRPHPKSSRTRQ